VSAYTLLFAGLTLLGLPLAATRELPGLGLVLAAFFLATLESEGQRAAVRAVMESEIVPVLDSLGLGASHAWRLRERGR
jgi:hypothetical protein